MDTCICIYIYRYVFIYMYTYIHIWVSFVPTRSFCASQCASCFSSSLLFSLLLFFLYSPSLFRSIFLSPLIPPPPPSFFIVPSLSKSFFSRTDAYRRAHRGRSLIPKLRTRTFKLKHFVMTSRR